MYDIFVQLKAISMYYKTTHWQCKNSVYYADHLLLDRLYKESHEDIDTIAEKMIGIGMGIDIVDLPKCLKSVFNKVKDLPYNQNENKIYFEAALKLENELLELCSIADKNPKTSCGTKNLIGDIADEAEARLYLIKQRISK
jgi:DNA-binding ferritin-like protein